MENMDPWCVKTHGESGLTQAVLESKISEAEAEQQVLDFVQKHTMKGTLYKDVELIRIFVIITGG